MSIKDYRPERLTLRYQLHDILVNKWKLQLSDQDLDIAIHAYVAGVTSLRSSI